MSTYFDAYGNPIKPKSSGVVLPLLLAVLLSAGGNYWLWKERSKATADAYAATAKLTAAEVVQKEAAEKIEKLEAERASLIEAKDQALKDAQARALELARLKDDVAGVEVTKEPEPEGDKKAESKAETKPKAKAKPKKKPAERPHKAKKEKDSDSAPSEREL